MRALLKILWRLASSLEPFRKFPFGKSVDSPARLCPYMDHEERLTVAGDVSEKGCRVQQKAGQSTEPVSQTSIGRFRSDIEKISIDQSEKLSSRGVEPRA